MLTLSIDTRAATPIYEQIMAQIREAVRQARIGPGTPLPPVRRLAADLEVNPNTVAKAYLLLEKEGVVHTVRRRACFVASDAIERVRRDSDARLDAAVDRVLAEGRRLGLGGEALLATLARRLALGSALPRRGEGPGPDERREGGHSR